MKTIEELEKDIIHYEKCLNGNNYMNEFILLEIENIQNKINFLLNRNLFEKKN